MATQALPIVLPTLVLAEVAGAIGRTRGNPAQAQTFAIALSNLPTVTLVSLDYALAQQTLQFNQAICWLRGFAIALCLALAKPLRGRIAHRLDNLDNSKE